MKQISNNNNNRQQFARKPQSLSKEKKENLSPTKKSQRFCRKPQTSTYFPSYNREPMKVKNQQMDKVSNEEIQIRQDVEMREENQNAVVKIENAPHDCVTQHHQKQQLPSTPTTTPQQYKGNQQSQSQSIFSFLKTHQGNFNNEPQNLHSQFQQQSLSSGNTSDQYSIVGDEDEFLTSFNNRFIFSQGEGENDCGKKVSKCEVDRSDRQQVCGVIDTNQHKPTLLQSPHLSQCPEYEIVGVSLQQYQNYSQPNEFNKSSALTKIIQYPEQCQQSGFIIQHTRDMNQGCSEQVHDANLSDGGNNKTTQCEQDRKEMLMEDCCEEKRHVAVVLVNNELILNQPTMIIDKNNNQNTSSQCQIQHQQQLQQKPQQPQLITFQKQHQQQQQTPHKYHHLQDITNFFKQQQRPPPRQLNYAADSFGNHLISSSLSMSHDNDSRNRFTLGQRGRKLIQISQTNNALNKNNRSNDKASAIIDQNMNDNSHTASFPITSKHSHYDRNKYCSFFAINDDSNDSSSNLEIKNKNNQPQYYPQQENQHEQQQRFTGDGCTSQSIPTSKSGYTFTDSGNERYRKHESCDQGSSGGYSDDVSIQQDLRPKYYNQISFTPQKNKGKSGNNFYYQFNRNYESYDDDDSQSEQGETDCYDNKGSKVFKVDYDKNDIGCNTNKSNNKIVIKKNSDSNKSISNNVDRTNHNHKAKNNHNVYGNPFRSPQLMRHLPSTVHNPTSHNNQFYTTHIQKMDSLIVEILQMKRTFQLHYLDSIRSQTQQNQSNTAVIMRQLAEIQNKLIDNQYQRNIVNQQVNNNKKYTNKTIISNNASKLNNKLRKLINYSSKDDYNGNDNKQSSLNNTSQVSVSSQNLTQLQCSIAQQLHAAKHNNLCQNYSHHSKSRLAFQRAPSLEDKEGMKKDKQQYIPKQNSLKYTHNGESNILPKPSQSSSIFNQQGKNLHHNNRDLLSVSLEQSSHDKSQLLVKISKHNLSRQSNEGEAKQYEHKQQESLMFSSKAKRNRMKNKSDQGSLSLRMNQHLQEKEQSSLELPFKTNDHSPQYQQSITPNHCDDVGEQNKQWRNSWDDENSGTISDNTSVQHSDDEQVKKQQIMVLNNGSKSCSNNLNSCDNSDSSSMMLSSMPYVCMVVSTKSQLKRALKTIKKQHGTIKSSAIQQNSQAHQQVANLMIDNSQTNYNQLSQSKQRILPSNQPEALRAQQQYQQANMAIVVVNQVNSNTNRNTFLIASHEGQTTQSKQQHKQQQAFSNQQNCIINVSGNCQNTKDNQLIRMRSVGAYYCGTLNAISYTGDCRNQKISVDVESKGYGLLALTCQQREEVGINNNNNAKQLINLAQLPQQQSNSLYLQISSHNNNNNKPSINSTEHHQSIEQYNQHHSICRITQPQIILCPPILTQHKPTVFPPKQQKPAVPISFNKKLKQGRCCRGVPRRVDVISNFRESLLNERRIKQRMAECEYYDHVIEDIEDDNSQPVKNESQFQLHPQESTAQSASSITAKLNLNSNSSETQASPQQSLFDSIYYQRHDKQLFKYNWFKFK